MSAVLSIWTVAVGAIFLGIVVWAWSANRKTDFDEAANMVFDQGERDEEDG